MLQTWDYRKKFEGWRWQIPEFYNVGYDCVDRLAERAGTKNKVALYWENEKGQAQKYTFWEMRTLSNRFGNVLRSLGIKKGDRFLIRLPNLPEFPVSFIGGVKIGAVPIPSSVMFTPKEIEYRINDSGAVAVVTTAQYVAEVEAVREHCPSLQHVIVVGDAREGQLPHTIAPQDLRVSRESCGPQFGCGQNSRYEELMSQSPRYLKVERTRAEDMAFICYTSGTTGDPKGAVHLHRWVIANDPMSRYWQAYRGDDIVAHTGALSWIYPLGNAFLYAWRYGTSVLLYDGHFDPEKWFSLLEKYEVTNLASVPTCYRMFLTVPNAEKRYDLSRLRHCISAGEPLNPEVVLAWKKRFGAEILDGIGMTEIMVYLSNMEGMGVKAGSCGRPLPGHNCAIVDQEGRPVPPGTPGTLAIRGDDPGLLKEYWNKPDKTAECYLNGWFLTGDTVYQDEDGYYWFSGRGDDLMMTAGYRVSPFEVESALIEHEAVLEAAAVATPDPIRGVNIKAFVVLQPGLMGTPELAKEIMAYVKSNVAAYKYPREVEFVKQLPKTQSGKIKRRLLRELERIRKPDMGQRLEPVDYEAFLASRADAGAE